MNQTAQLDRLWDEFHHAVNMTSRELSDWLRTQSAGERAEALPTQSDLPTGEHVLRILAKRRTDLTVEDLHLMERVVERVRVERGNSDGARAGETSWRHRLMNVGHDPLKPS